MTRLPYSRRLQSKTPSPRSLTPSAPAAVAQKSNGGAATSTSGDAFGDLLSGSFGANPSNANLSIAEQAARANARVIQQPPIPPQTSSAWAGLDSLGGGAPFSSSLQHNPATPEADDDWIFGSTTTPAPKLSNDDLGIEDFVSRPKPSDDPLPPRPPKANSLWDLDDFNSASNQGHRISSPASNLPLSRSDTPGDFDFGDRENALLDDDSGSDDDILGDLGKPARVQPTSTARSSHSNVAPAHRPPSPPPHLIGQIVEMGFSPDLARAALASTDLPQFLLHHARLEDCAQRATVSRTMMAGESKNKGLSHQRQHSRQQIYPSRERSPLSSSEANYQQQADKLIAQASEIGSRVFQRANAFWKEGKSRVAKAYEDRAPSSRAGSTGYNEGPSGRPRWMQEAPENDQAISPGEPSRNGFRDEGADSIPAPPNPSAPTRARPQVKPSHPDQTKKIDIFSEDTPTAYVSPFRRGAGSRTAPVQAVSTRAPSPVRLTQRNVISASPPAISASAEHKASGTEMFKLGRFAEAETAYSSAISRLPDSHLLLVPLLNNRGLSRFKTGNISGAIEDFTCGHRPRRPVLPPGDALGKAWRRRAEAYEGREKWDLARQDWESIVGADFASRHRGEALSGIGRCKKMVSAGDAPDVVTPSAPRVNTSRPTRRPAARRGPTPPSEAVVRLKQANQEAEAEEQARLELKDSVDSRLAAWKNGKETNLRALVASLDTVLWPELGWQKVGMAELVTSNQVKIRYTKAIAKLHPDKLNVKNTTLEQRMIANGVFGTLNDAWNAFKP
ncbi:hypothetical protein EDB92DRAFT_1947922 [Lactarius akahatsu]|uniref:UBA domain-containing protein n=1 Tax=Lactarius akahatsu TaxID=416441 RepID=A0AAD4LD54_9AGAM|nr:hypothetical protein EDB92DRAFT_1947922 [Lactarius akahatsu]